MPAETETPRDTAVAATPEIVLDTGGWISGPALNVKHRQLARDIRSDRVGVLMAGPDEWGAKGQYWLRPVGGGIEWDVPREFVQLLDAAGAAE